MPQEKLKQVAVRMSPRLHKAALKTAKREKVSFGALVREAVNSYIVWLERERRSGGGE